MIYVTADVHGKFAEFLTLLHHAHFFEHNDNHLYVLGDVIDRNENGGVDMLKWMIEHTDHVSMILGNHENMMLKSRWIFEDLNGTYNGGMIRTLDRWLRYGGDCTVKAMRRESIEVQKKIFDYLQTVPLYRTIQVNGKDYILVHGGLGNFAKTKALEDYTEDELLLERPCQTTAYWPEKFKVVIGHTPTSLYSKDYRGRMLKTDSWYNIDTGAAYPEGFPMLLCLDTEQEYYIEKKTER